MFAVPYQPVSQSCRLADGDLRLAPYATWTVVIGKATAESTQTGLEDNQAIGQESGVHLTTRRILLRPQGEAGGI